MQQGDLVTWTDINGQPAYGVIISSFVTGMMTFRSNKTAGATLNNGAPAHKA